MTHGVTVTTPPLAENETGIIFFIMMIMMMISFPTTTMVILMMDHNHDRDDKYDDYDKAQDIFMITMNNTIMMKLMKINIKIRVMNHGS